MYQDYVITDGRVPHKLRKRTLNHLCCIQITYEKGDRGKEMWLLTWTIRI